MNHYLQNRQIKIDSLEQLRDGYILAQLLEILSGEKIPKTRKDPKMRAFKLENANMCLYFISERLKIKLFGCAAQGTFLARF
jgi:hypothetical protein